MAEHKHSATCGCSEAAKVGAQIDSLYQAIDTTKVWCLNESEPDSGKNCLKPHHERFDETRVLKSEDDDPELLLFIPFTAQVKLVSFALIATGETAPKKARLFVNREDLDFSNVGDASPTQTLELNPDSTGEIFYQLQLSKFQNVSSVLFHFPESEGGDQTVIQYLCLRGEATKNRREIIHVTYEARPIPEDHKAKSNAEKPAREIS